jgi:hypothetical protein
MFRVFDLKLLNKSYCYSIRLKKHIVSWLCGLSLPLTFTYSLFSLTLSLSPIFSSLSPFSSLLSYLFSFSLFFLISLSFLSRLTLFHFLFHFFTCSLHLTSSHLFLFFISPLCSLSLSFFFFPSVSLSPLCSLPLNLSSFLSSLSLSPVHSLL